MWVPTVLRRAPRIARSSASTAGVWCCAGWIRKWRAGTAPASMCVVVRGRDGRSGSRGQVADDVRSGTAVVVQLELEAALHGCRAVWLLTEGASGFFDRLGYARCDRAVVPPRIRETRQFASLCPAGAEVLIKRLPA